MTLATLNRAGWLRQDHIRSASQTLTLLSLGLSSVVAPLLPPIQWKVNATLLSAAMLVVALYLRVRIEGKMDRSRLDLPLLGFLTAAILATVLSVDRLMSFYPSPLRGEGLLLYVAYVVMALASARLVRTQVTAILTAVLISGTLVGVIAWSQHFGFDLIGRTGFEIVPALQLGDSVPIWSDGPGVRSYGTLGNPMFLGAYMAMLLPMALARATGSSKKIWWVYAATTFVLFGGLVASGTRAAWVAAVFGGIVFARLLPLVRADWRRVAVLAAGMLAVFLLMTLTRPDASLPQRAASTIDLHDGSLRERVYIWKHTVSLIAARPVLGWGFSTLMGRFPDYGSQEYLEVYGSGAVHLIDNPHNELLNFAFSTGLVGLAAYLWIWAVVAKGLQRTLSAERNGVDLTAALTVSLLVYFVWMQFAWSAIGLGNILWLFLGLSAARNPTDIAHS